MEYRIIKERFLNWEAWSMPLLKG